MSESEEEFYEVDRIVDHKAEGKKTFYKVRWKGYSPSQDTWEPQDHLGEGCDEVIAAYFEWRAANVKSKHKKKTAEARYEAMKASQSKSPQTAALPLKSPPKSPNYLLGPASVENALSQQFNLANIAKQNKTTTSLLQPPPTATVTAPGAQMVVQSGLQTTLISPQRSIQMTSAAPSRQQSVSESETTVSDTLDSDTAATESVTDVFCTSTAAQKAIVEEVKEETFQCPHQTKYSSAKAQEYQVLSRRYEVNSDTVSFVSESQKCITVIMSQLCDPYCVDLDPVLKELQGCALQWSKIANRRMVPTKLSLMSALLIASEAEVLTNSQLYEADVNRAIPGNWTPLHFAAAMHKFDVCDWILKQRCWSDIVTISQETPLTLALRTALPSKHSDRLLQFVTKLISLGANVQHKDSSGRLPITMAKKHKYTFIQNSLVAHHQRLKNHTTVVMATHLQTHKDNLFVKEYFLEPQLITQPPGVTYTIRFKFKEPSEPVVARLNVAYYVPPQVDSLTHLANAPVKLSSDGPFPFKSITLNGHDIKPQNAECKSITLQSALTVGSNVLEMETLDYNDKRPLDSAMIFGCLIGKSPL